MYEKKRMPAHRGRNCVIERIDSNRRVKLMTAFSRRLAQSIEHGFDEIERMNDAFPPLRPEAFRSGKSVLGPVDLYGPKGAAKIEEGIKEGRYRRVPGHQPITDQRLMSFVRRLHDNPNDGTIWDELSEAGYRVDTQWATLVSRKSRLLFQACLFRRGQLWELCTLERTDDRGCFVGPDRLRGAADRPGILLALGCALLFRAAQSSLKRARTYLHARWCLLSAAVRPRRGQGSSKSA